MTRLADNYMGLTINLTQQAFFPYLSATICSQLPSIYFSILKRGKRLIKTVYNRTFNSLERACFFFFKACHPFSKNNVADSCRQLCKQSKRNDNSDPLNVTIHETGCGLKYSSYQDGQRNCNNYSQDLGMGPKLAAQAGVKDRSKIINSHCLNKVLIATMHNLLRKTKAPRNLAHCCQ